MIVAARRLAAHALLPRAAQKYSVHPSSCYNIASETGLCRRYRHQIMLGIACYGCSLDIDTRSVRRNKCNNATASTALSVASFLVCMVLGAPGLGGSRPPVRAIVNATVMSGCAHSAWFSVASAAAYVRKTVVHAPPCKACGCAAVHFGLNLVSSGRDAQQG